MTVDGAGRITVTGDGTGTGSGSSDGALLTTRLTAGGAPDPTFGRGGDGKVATQGLPDGSFPTCGATRTASGGLLTGFGSTLVQLTSRGARRAAFAPAGVLEIAQPENLGINAVERWDPRRVVAAGSAGQSLYLSRYVLPKRR